MDTVVERLARSPRLGLLYRDLTSLWEREQAARERFYEGIEDGEKVEFINGEILQKPMPQGHHSAIQGELVPFINRLRQNKIARAFPELRCTFGGRSTVPDVAAFTWDRIPQNESGILANVFPIAPDWTIEILSPDRSQTKVVKNILHALEYGALMGWLIDPDEQTVFVYRSKQEVEIFDKLDQLLPMPEFAQGLALTIGELFSWLIA